uniref:DUF4346 domain-containing protein n=1 Tax=Ceramothamnion japonicum TaxID=218448 RepID=A0A1C9CDB2_CERJP|nr:hypothetical protein Ceram_071 [Ceramium japonicum]AOM66347.1 hypothetical protein Ceram_071 [Ceramium japonicum]
MDSFYCLVSIILNKKISLYCFKNTHSNYIAQKMTKICYPICFSAKSSKNILKLFSLHSYNNLISINHAFYLGQELYKAELSLFFNQVYIQN